MQNQNIQFQVSIACTITPPASVGPLISSAHASAWVVAVVVAAPRCIGSVRLTTLVAGSAEAATVVLFYIDMASESPNNNFKSPLLAVTAGAKTSTTALGQRAPLRFARPVGDFFIVASSEFFIACVPQ